MRLAHPLFIKIIKINYLYVTKIRAISFSLADIGAANSAPVTLSASSKTSPQNEATVKASSHSQQETKKQSLSTNEPLLDKETATNEQAEPVSEWNAMPEGESTSEPNNEPGGASGESEPSAEPETWPEPGPQWKTAFKKWKAAWPIHVYAFAIAFLIIGIYAGYYVVLNIYDGLDSKYLSVCLNAMVLLFGITRAFVLFFDPYHQGNLINAIFAMRLIWSIGGPCLTASDCLVILALVETSKVSIAPPKFQKLETISIVIGIHFVLVIVSDTVVSMYMEAKVMILMCQIFFSVWGIVLGAGYANLAYKLDKKLFSHKQEKDKADKIYIFLIYASGAANFFICFVMIYTMVGVFGVYSDITFVDAWHWWTLQTLFRSGEVITCSLILTVSAKRKRVAMAADEISTCNSQSEIVNSSVGCSAFRKLRIFFNQIRNRSRVVDIAVLSDEPGTTKTSFKKKANDTSIEVSSAFQALQERGRGRRQSLFSHMQETAIENRISQLEEAPAVVPSGRRRKQSLFSAMHEASINNAVANFANIITQANTDIVCESLESNLNSSDQHEEHMLASLPRRGRRANVFSTIQETRPGKHIKRQAMMEDIREESTMYEEETESIRRPPLLKKRSSERLRQIFSSLVSSVSKLDGVNDPRNNIVEEDEKEGNSVEDSNSIPVEHS